MKTKPYIIDDVIYHVPEKVAETTGESHCQIFDQRQELKRMQQEVKDIEQSFNKLLEDYKELKKENGYLVRILEDNDLDGNVLVTIPDKYNPDNLELDEEYSVPERVKGYIEDLYEVIRAMEGEIDDLKDQLLESDRREFGD